MANPTPEQVQAMLKQYLSQSEGAQQGASGGDTSEKSLLEFLDINQLNCLNENDTDGHTLKSIVSSKRANTSDAYLISDADEQLLLNVHFNQAVRVRSIQISSKVAKQAPKKIKLVVNRPAVGFDDVEDAEEPAVAQVLELPQDGKPVALRYVRFQNVSSLHIFVASNYGGEDETRIDSIDVIGFPVATTKDLSGLANQDDHEH